MLSSSARIAVESETLGVAGDNGDAFATGTGSLQPAGFAGELRNIGDGLLVLLIFTVAPVAV